MNKANLSVAGAARADGGGRRASRSQPAPLSSLGSSTLGPGMRLTTYGFSFPISYPARDDLGSPQPGTHSWLAGGKAALGATCWAVNRPLGVQGGGSPVPPQGKADQLTHLASHAARARRLPHNAGPSAPARVYTPWQVCRCRHACTHDMRSPRKLKDAVRADRPLPLPTPTERLHTYTPAQLRKTHPRGGEMGSCPRRR